MSGVGLQEFVVLFVIGLLILGPERLPRVASQIGRWVGKARRTANQLRYQLEREITIADIEDRKKKKEQQQSPQDAGDKPGANAGSTDAEPAQAQEPNEVAGSTPDDSAAESGQPQDDSKSA